MRFIVIVKATEETEAGVRPSAELLEEMGTLNEELVNAVVLLVAEGGIRSVELGGDRRAVIDGPFTETKELLVGFRALTRRAEARRRGSPSRRAGCRGRARA